MHYEHDGSVIGEQVLEEFFETGYRAV